MTVNTGKIIKAGAVLSVCVSLLVAVGCQTIPGENRSQGQDETAVVSVLANWEHTWNAHDTEGNLVLLNDNARVMYGRDHHIASKDEYRQIFDARPKDGPALKLGRQDIHVAGNKAEVKVDLSIGNYSAPYFFTLVNENGRWTIMSWRY